MQVTFVENPLSKIKIFFERNWALVTHSNFQILISLKPLIFIIWYNWIHCLKCLKSTALDLIDMGIIKSEFVAKTQLLYNIDYQYISWFRQSVQGFYYESKIEIMNNSTLKWYYVRVELENLERIVERNSRISFFVGVYVYINVDLHQEIENKVRI